MYLRYSFSVVAPMQVISPRDSAGLRMLAASSEPSAEPAPISDVELVDEDDDLGVLLQLLEDRLQPLLELAAVLGPGHHAATDRGRGCAGRRAATAHCRSTMRCREPLDDGGLADAGLAEQHRVVLGAAQEDLDDAVDLVLAADQRVEAARRRELGEVPGELAEWAVTCGLPRPRARALPRSSSRSWKSVDPVGAQVAGGGRARGAAFRAAGARCRPSRGPALGLVGRERQEPAWCPRPAAAPARAGAFERPRSPSSSARRSLTLAATRSRSCSTTGPPRAATRAARAPADGAARGPTAS